MKSKKLFLPTIILLSAIVAMTIYGTVTNIAKKPTTPEYDFPFSITYELNGKTETFDGIYSVSYVGNDGYIDTTIRQYEGTFISQREDADTTIILSDGKDGTIYLHTHFYPDYLMGDPRYDTYFSNFPFAPALSYTNFELGTFEDEETLLEHGARLISWEYPEPIENSFVFSHIAPFNSYAVAPFIIIAALALLAVIIFVKKDGAGDKRWRNITSIVLNFLLALVFVPISTILAFLSDINGSSTTIFHLAMYLAPSITLLALAASVALRRKGFGRAGLIVQLAFPCSFTLLIAFGMLL